jgi:lysophospholipase L1-like esterase
MARGIEKPPFWAIAVIVVSTVGLIVLGFVAAGRETSLSPERVAAANASLDAYRASASSAAAASEEANRKPVVAFLGDSYAAGDGAANKETDRWSALVSADFGWDEANFGFGGTAYSTGGILDGGQPFDARIADVAAASPTMVVVSGGRNDAQPEDLADRINSTFQNLRSALPNAIIVAIQPMYDSKPYPDRLTEESALIQSAVTAAGGTYLSLPNPLEGRPDLISSDGVHPTNEGHRILADAVEQAMSTAGLPDAVVAAE